MEDPLLPMHVPTPVIADWKRERDVYDLCAAFHDIPRIENLGESPDTHSFPLDFVPKPASDAPLAAFTQLAALRLHAQRSMISLLDGQYQYILAETTPSTSLRFDSPINRNLDILLGNVRIPRNWGLCERVLDPVALAEDEPGIIIIKDLSQSKLHQNRSYVTDGPKFRFYAGVPLRSPNGTIVGSMCIFDGPERQGMSPEDIMYLQDLAATAMEYLVTYTIQEQHRRGAEGLHGLLSFAEGDSKLKSSKEYYGSPSLSRKAPNLATKLAETPAAQETQHDASAPLQSAQQKQKPGSPTKQAFERRYSAGDLQDKMLPNTTRELFSRAADILKKSSDMDGVMFVNASVAATAATGGMRTPTRASGKQCQILGFAIGDKASLRNDEMPDDIMIPLEGSFVWLLKQYSRGYSLDCDEGRPKSWTDDEDSDAVPSSPENSKSNGRKPQTSRERQAEHVLRVKALFPNIKSALFLPLWDFERNRWFAGCFCWSVRAERNLNRPLELPFLKVFGHSIMQEVAKLDAHNTSQTKTTFLSSLSHELRSPLHGILGSIQLMRSTPLDSFQTSMVNSITVCGRTLLETVQHLLDHAERRECGGSPSTKTYPRENTVCITSDPFALELPPKATSANSFCNIGLVTEEVVETMVLGQVRYDFSVSGNEIPGAPVYPSSKSEIASRRNRLIIVDIGDYANLDFSISASSYGRLVMNLLGNALKFTESGYILVWLRAHTVDGSKTAVTLKITDSGTGIANEFLLKEAFEPFRKGNQHTAGTGVGLNVVKRIIEDIGGSIEVSSEPNKGTDITLRLTFDRSKRPEDLDSQHGTILSNLSQLKNRKICIFHAKSPDENGPPDSLRQWEILKRNIAALFSTLQDELKMTVTQTSDWDGLDESDIVICPEVSFESLQMIRNASNRRLPATLFVAMDSMEAETLRCDARVMSSDSVVEVMTQPCGPFKLGMILCQCLHRHDARAADLFKDANIASDPNSFSSPQLVSPLAPRLSLYPPTLEIRSSSSSSSSLPTRQRPSVVESASPTSTEKSDLSDLGSLANLRVLIVDDNAINRRLLAAFMKKRRIPFEEANDGLKALEKYREAERKFDVVLMDISMPVMDGMTSTRLIREHETEIQLNCAHIIALTGLTSASAKLEAWSSGVDDFLTKPVDFKKLESLMKAGRGGEGTGFLRDQEGDSGIEKPALSQSSTLAA